MALMRVPEECRKSRYAALNFLPEAVLRCAQKLCGRHGKSAPLLYYVSAKQLTTFWEPGATQEYYSQQIVVKNKHKQQQKTSIAFDDRCCHSRKIYSSRHEIEKLSTFQLRLAFHKLSHGLLRPLLR